MVWDSKPDVAFQSVWEHEDGVMIYAETRGFKAQIVASKQIEQVNRYSPRTASRSETRFCRL